MHNGADFGRICTHTITGNDMAEEGNTLPEELTLLWVELEMSFSQTCQHNPQMLKMFFPGAAKYDHVIKVGKANFPTESSQY